MLVGGTGIRYFVGNEWNNLSISNVLTAILLIGSAWSECRSNLVLMDEPFSALDALTRGTLQDGCGASARRPARPCS